MKSQEKIRAVLDMTRPSNADEVRRFLGMITYYSRFIENLSTLTYPLRQLLRKNRRFKWTADCESSFLKLKQEMCSERILVPFDPDLPVVLTADASPVGIGAVLSHIVDGQERPVAYASRSLTPAEQNYGQLDREGLALVFGVGRFYNYLFGRHLFLVTDNSPLSKIISHNRALPKMTTARLLRYASFLAGFDYTEKCKKGEDNKNADCLSRLPVGQTNRSIDMKMNEEVNRVYAETLLQISSSTITAQTIIQETARDPTLMSLIENLQTKNEDSPYTICNGMIFWQDRVVIPQNLRASVLEELHSTHIGITKMKQLSRRYVYWEGINQEIEQLVRACEQCAMLRNNPPRVDVHPWDEPQHNWERVHIDYAGPFEGCYFLVAVDAKSKWSEVRVQKNAPSTSITISLLNEIFSFHGHPNFLVSDNESIFTSEDFRTYCSNNGISQKLIAPGHPATNGLAERNVQTLKKRLKAMNTEPGSMGDKVRRMLLHYRATPLACGKSPAELYLNRRMRIRLDAIFPAILKENTPAPCRPVRSFKAGERIQTRMYKNNSEIWEFGVITEKLGSRHYIVELDSGRKLKRHTNQLVSTNVPLPELYRPNHSQQPRGQKVRFTIPGIPGLQQNHRPSDDVQQPNQENTVSSPQGQPSQPEDTPLQELRRSTRNVRPPTYLGDYVLH